MKKILIVLGVLATFIATTAFVTSEKSNIIPGPGDGVTTCEIYGVDGYTATVVEKVIVPSRAGSLTAKVKLNKPLKSGCVSIVVQLRDSLNCVIESQEIKICSGTPYASGEKVFNHKGSSGDVYYVTINSASCN